MKNWFKENIENVMNTLYKIIGIMTLTCAFLYTCNMYHPNKINIFCYLLVIGLLFLSIRYTPNYKNTTTLNDYFYENYIKGVIYHSVGVYLSDKNKLCFYIHADKNDNNALDFEVQDNELININNKII